MLEATGNLFDYPADCLVVPVNWATKRDGAAVMGAGVALQAAKRWPWLPARLGACIADASVTVRAFPTLPDGLWVVALPTKRDWHDPADVDLIEAMLPSLLRLAEHHHWRTVALPRLGCGERTGRLAWSDVKPVLERYLDDKFVVCHLEAR